MKKVVICGGGIIGASTAYYLSVLDISKTLDITVIERETIACHSSGKAGGFLALDWHNSKTEPLAKLSYALHEELSRTLSADTGYRNVSSFSIDSRASKSSKVKKKSTDSWIDGNILQKDTIGTTKTTSQVHPFILTNELMNFAMTNGAKLKKGVVIGVDKDENNDISHVNLSDGSHLEADVVVISMGAWSFQAADYFPLCKNAFQVEGQKAHSVILEANVPAEALFIHHIDDSGQSLKSHEPEIYPRPDGTVYVCGEGDESILPEDPSLITPSPNSCEKLQELAASVSSHLKGAKLLHKQACYIPCSPDGIPIIGKLPFYKEAYVGTGHGVWGILNGPATGKCLAQVILDIKPDIDLTLFSPNRFLI